MKSVFIKQSLFVATLFCCNQAIFGMMLSTININSQKKKCAEATQYNCNNKFLSLPQDTLCFIFAHNIDNTGLLFHNLEKKIIKPTLSFSTICKKLTRVLFPQIIHIVCQPYTLKDKNIAVETWLESTYNRADWYTNKREIALFLTYAGAKNNACKGPSLLEQAIYYEDKKMIKVLLNNNVDPHQMCPVQEYPNFFSISTLDLIQIFMQHNVNLNELGANYHLPNVLWACLRHEHSLDLIKFYIDHKVDITIKNSHNDCLFHWLAESPYYKNHSNNCIVFATLFLDASPGIINTINNYDQTPLDCAYETLNFLKTTSASYKISCQLIELFKKYGGKTAQELQKT